MKSTPASHHSTFEAIRIILNTLLIMLQRSEHGSAGSAKRLTANFRYILGRGGWVDEKKHEALFFQMAAALLFASRTIIELPAATQHQKRQLHFSLNKHLGKAAL
jgi:hypothetical protein